MIAAEPKPTALGDFVRPLLFSSAAINFDGTRVAALSAGPDGRTSLLLYDVDARKARTIRPGGVRDVFRFAWLDDTHLIFNVVRDNRYAHGLYVIDVRQLDRRANLNWGDSVRFVGAPRSHPLQPIVWIRQGSATEGREDGLLQYDGNQSFNSNLAFSDDYYGYPNTGANVLRRLLAPADTALRYTADRFGELAYAETTRQGISAIWHWETGHWEKCPIDVDATAIAGFGPELLLHTERTGQHPRGVQRYDARTKTAGPVLLQIPRHDVTVDRIHQRDGNGEIIGLNYTAIGPKSVWFDNELGALQAEVEQQLPGMVVRCEGFDRAEIRFLFRAFSDRHPGTFYVFDRRKNELAAIANAAPWIVPEQMCPTHLLQFKAQDGMELDGLLTLPLHRKPGQPPPAVVIPGDSADSRVSWDWDETAQLLASRGYAVFRPNHRGSGLYGWKTRPGVEWDFRQIHQDVTDGVKAVIRSELVDGRRVAILGTQFGAFLALCGVAYEPDLYRAGIGIEGTYDWVDAAKELALDPATSGDYGVVRRYLGEPAKDATAYATIAPLKKIADVKAAFLVARGQSEEGPTSSGQSRRLVSALNAQHKTVDVVAAEGIASGFYDAESRLKLAKAIDAFLARHIPVE